MPDVVMPQMGESIVEGTLTRWLKKPGDTVQRDEPLFEISTDKVDTEIPSPASGVLSEVLVQEGQTVAINTVVARISDGAGAAAPAPVVQAAPPPPPVPVAAPAPVPVAAPPPVVAPAAPTVADLGPLSPLVRKMARENEVDLTAVSGTGAGGRITKQDVEAVIAKPAAVPVAAPAAATFAPPPPRTEAAKVRVEPMSTMRKKIAEHMSHSLHTSAHVTTVHKVDMTAVARIREKNKAAFQAQYGFSLTFLPFVAAATCKALREFPILNASIDGTNILYHGDINLGFAVALDNGSGLIVPVVANADEKNVTGLQRSIVDLAARARSRQLKPEEVKGGTFAITNFGSFGSVFATPVINQPNVGILGVGTVEKTPVVINDAIAIRSICYVALTFDHRLIDGALADMFTGRVKQLLENWSDSVL